MEYLNNKPTYDDLLQYISKLEKERGDITSAEHKIEELTRLLKTSEERYRVFFENDLTSDFILDGKGFIKSCNAAFLDLFGYESSDELIGKHISTTYQNPDDANLIFNQLQIQKNLKKIETVRKRKNGTTIHVLENKVAIYDDNCEITEIKGYLFDITDHIKAELALRQSEEKYRTITERSHDIIMRFDRQYRHLYANPASTTFFGIETDAFFGKTHKELGFPKEEYEYWEKRIQSVFDTGKVVKEVASVKTEQIIWFDWNLIPEFNNRGEVETVLSYCRDITDLKNTQLQLIQSEKKYHELSIELQQKNEEFVALNEEYKSQNDQLHEINEKLRKNEALLTELNATKDRFFSIIAHDLRGPIGSFKSLLELIITKFDLTDTQSLTNVLEVMHESSSKVYELLENLLQWAKSQKNEIAFNPEPVDLHQITSDCIAVLGELIHKKDVTIHNSIPKQMIVTGDKNMLLTIVRNLISNAIKFTHPHKNIYISVQYDNQTCTISIKDEGVGIKSENLNKLFSFSEHVTTNGTSGEIGSGLGLVLCKEFVLKHEGKIWVESIEGEGSEFKIMLPVKQQ